MVARGRSMNAPTLQKDRDFSSLSFFTHLALQGIVCYTFVGALSGGNEPPLCKGRWLARARRRDCKKLGLCKKQSLSPLSLATFDSSPLHKGAFRLCAPKVRLLFLTSTAFVDTKAKLTFKIHIYSFEQLLLTVIVLGHSLCQFQSSFAVVCCCCGTAQIENGLVSVFLNRTFCDNILTKLI